MLGHVGIQVADVKASLAFYLGVFAPCGVHEAMRLPHGEAFVVGLAGADGVPQFWLSQSSNPETRELHLALSAPDRKVMERFVGQDFHFRHFSEPSEDGWAVRPGTRWHIASCPSST